MGTTHDGRDFDRDRNGVLARVRLEVYGDTPNAVKFKLDQAVEAVTCGLESYPDRYEIEGRGDEVIEKPYGQKKGENNPEYWDWKGRLALYVKDKSEDAIK